MGATATPPTTAAKNTEPTGTPGVLKLAGGATVTVPAGATLKADAPSMDFKGVKTYHTYELPGEKRILLVGEMDLEGKSCSEALDARWADMQSATKSQDPKQLAMRKDATAEELKVAGRRVLFSGANWRGIGDKDKGRPFVPITSAVMCEGENMVAVMHTAVALGDDDPRKIVLGVIGSYRAPTP